MARNTIPCLGQASDPIKDKGKTIPFPAALSPIAQTKEYPRGLQLYSKFQSEAVFDRTQQYSK